MGQVLHGSASTTQAVRRAIQASQAVREQYRHSQESIRVLARRHGINPKTVVKWKRRTSTNDAPMGPKTPRSTVLSEAEEAIVVAFRKHDRQARAHAGVRPPQAKRHQVLRADEREHK